MATNSLAADIIYFCIINYRVKQGDEKLTGKDECRFPGGGEPQGNEQRVGFQLKVLEHMFRRDMEAGIRKIGFEGMSVINAWIIDYLAQNEDRDIFQKDIEKNFKIGKSSIAGTLKMMEKKGFIIRESVQGDARLKRVCLTDKGREYADKMEQGRDDMEKKICTGLTEEEIASFFRIIKKMQDNLLE
ncbi:MAG: MarR family winged helix-turn-helix transcriptional regulator [Bacteroidales bacterium]|nr:MarR family winged helix-turn-helix transcriptional regulator [Clostridium sp.]MCM1203906.1 MarR family winged helix-turn-helix transcriptional regulator [Bacteroidales bacterium]